MPQIARSGQYLLQTGDYTHHNPFTLRLPTCDDAQSSPQPAHDLNVDTKWGQSLTRRTAKAHIASQPGIVYASNPARQRLTPLARLPPAYLAQTRCHQNKSSTPLPTDWFRLLSIGYAPRSDSSYFGPCSSASTRHSVVQRGPFSCASGPLHTCSPCANRVQVGCSHVQPCSNERR